MRRILLLLILFNCTTVAAQHTFSCLVKDAGTKEPLSGVTASVKGASRLASSNENGQVVLKDLSPGTITIVLSMLGYEAQTIAVSLPQADTQRIIYLHRSEAKTEEEVIISSSRTNSRIEDLPTKVEVLGSEEVDEEAGTIPGNIASLLGDIAGIQNQRTSGTTANIDLRVQGLPGKYTQILRDGLPLFGGYSGSFSVLQIPPLDLKQVEIIKGASSTLYGGGAIAGMINLISKTPRLNEQQHSILANYSTLNEFNLNTYHSGRNKTTGYTLFAGTTQQRATDVNGDGFSDVPDLNSFFLHPKLFLYAGEKNTITLEYDGTYEDREGGDMQVLHGAKDNQHQFFIRNRSLRHSIIGTWENRVNQTSTINFKGSLSFFNRHISTNVFGMKAGQQTFFTELSYLKKWTRHTLVAGINISGEYFKKKQPDSAFINPYDFRVLGAFVQDDWRITQKLTAQTGLRLDYNDLYEPILLPRVSLLYRINHRFTSRLGGGLGYKAPSIFNNDVDERDLHYYYLAADILAEKSLGINWDITYKQTISDWAITINQMVYFTQINRPMVLENNPIYYKYVNATKPLTTKGFETYVALMHDDLEVYLGYTYTDARQLYNPAQPYMPLSARSKFAAVISNEFSPRLRACMEASYTGRQYLDNGTKTPGYLITAAMVRYDIKKFSFVLNCENIFDYRQTRKESIVYGNMANPSFKQIWAPVDGRVVNLSVRVNF